MPAVILPADDAHAGTGATAGMVWGRTYGGTQADVGNAVQQTRDGGLIIAGTTASFGGTSQALLIKTAADGTETWLKTFGSSFREEVWSVQQTHDDGYILCGTTARDGLEKVWLVKTDSAGELEWEATFGGDGWDVGRAVRQTTDRGYIIAGWTTSHGVGEEDVYLIKTDENGNLVWEMNYGGSKADRGYDIIEIGGGHVVIGQTYSKAEASSDIYLIKVDRDGKLLWERTFGGDQVDIGSSIQPTTDGGFIIGGSTYSKGAGLYDAWLIKTDSAGNRQWERTYGGAEDDFCRALRHTADGGYIFVGETSSFKTGGPNVWVVKTDSSGNVTWSQVLGGVGADRAWGVWQSLDRGYVVVGETSSFGAGDRDVWLIKLSNPPDQPANLKPVAGASGQEAEPTLESADFFDPDEGDTHAASQWQISAISGDFSAPVFDSGADASALTSIEVPSGLLGYNQTYYWRVRHQDNHGSWSSYSTQTSFTTKQVAPDQPANVSPVHGATNVSATPTLRGSAFVHAEPDNSHAASHWQIREVDGDHGNVFDNQGDRSLTSIAVPRGNLDYEDEYYWRVRYQDSHGLWSDWSLETSFTTQSKPPAPTASFSAEPRTGGSPLTVQFTCQSTGEITGWKWVFQTEGGSASSTDKNPAANLPEGTWTVTLTVTGPGGSDTMVKEDYIVVGRGAAAGGACDCPAVDSAPSGTELMIGWGITGIVICTGYGLTRAAARRYKDRRH